MAAEAVRDERIEALPLSTMARVYSLSSFEWLKDRSDALRMAADTIVVEALEIVEHDSVFIGAKIHRALDGRDRWEHGDEPLDEDPVQNDWNGSAKVALISVKRSETAWQTIAAASSDPVATVLAEQLAAMRESLLEAFPRAMTFVRPGFDEPWR